MIPTGWENQTTLPMILRAFRLRFDREATLVDR